MEATRQIGKEIADSLNAHDAAWRNLPWTEADNERRCDLIDKQIDGTISELESFELGWLQEAMLEHRQRVAPLPLDELRQMCDEFRREHFAKQECDEPDVPLLPAPVIYRKEID